MNTRNIPLAVAALAGLSLLAGCAPKPAVMAPPMPAPAAPPMNAGMPAGAPVEPGAAGVYQWRDVPPNQEVPITRAVFDQGGYQLYAASGETIVVPFANQNMYVMKFGKSSTGTTYFVNDNGQAPTLYVPNGGYLENAAASGAKWYPFPANYNYVRPVYMGLAPTWGDYMAMGWYPGMAYYGGYWGYNPWRPGIGFVAMPGLMINIGGTPYYGWGAYRNYYSYNSVGRVGWSNYQGYNYSSVGRRSASTGSFGRGAGASGSFGRGRTTGGSFGRSAGGTGSFGTGRTGGGSSFGRSSGSAGSFGSGRTTGSGSSFGRSTGGGSFGSGSSGSSFGTARNSPSGGSSFGSGRSSFGGGSSSGFGSSSGSRGSFGSGSSGFGSSSGSSFGRSSGGSSFGGGSSSSGSSFGRSSGGSSFGGGSRSSFGGGRRR